MFKRDFQQLERLKARANRKLNAEAARRAQTQRRQTAVRDRMTGDKTDQVGLGQQGILFQVFE